MSKDYDYCNAFLEEYREEMITWSLWKILMEFYQYLKNKDITVEEPRDEQITTYPRMAGKATLVENEKLKAHISHLQTQIAQLERIGNNVLRCFAWFSDGKLRRPRRVSEEQTLKALQSLQQAIESNKEQP